jgi:membrane associated rhomboid family serine protease
MQYLAAVLQLEQRSRRRLTVKGRATALVVSPWLWRTVFGAAGIAIVVSLVGLGGSLGAWLATLAAAAGGVALAMVLAVVLRRIRRRFATHRVRVRHPAGV